MISSKIIGLSVLSITFAILASSSNLLGFLAQSAYADFNFDAAGDWGCNSNTGKTVTNIQGKKPERVLALGDYSYTSTATCWLNTINPIKSITRIAIGNHENDADEANSKYMSSFGLSKPYYSFDYVNAHVLTMASESSFSKGSSQYNFVLDDLQKASTNPNIKWIIVNFHTPLYTSPNTCSASTCKGSSSLRDIYHPLFDKYGVDLVLQGHVHNYQRTFPLKYNTNSHSSPTKTSTSTSAYTDPQGEIFVIIGTGGINFHGLSGKSSFVVNQQDKKFGMFDILMANDGSKLTAKYFTNGASSPSDQFTISKPVSISSLKISSANKVNVTNQTNAQTINNQTSAIQIANNTLAVNKGPSANKNQEKNNLSPEVAQILRNANVSEKTLTNSHVSKLNNNSRIINDQNNLNSKPITPKETTKNVNPVERNIRPDAIAGKNQKVVEGSKVILDGSMSNDRDGHIDSYHWQQITGPGPKVALDNPNKIEASFVAPPQNRDTIFVFKLTVTDDKGGSDSAITSVKVVKNEEESATSSSIIPELTSSNIENVTTGSEHMNNSSLR